MFNYIDTHAHLDDKKFDDDRETLIEKCKAHGVDYILDPAVNIETCGKVTALAEKHDFIFTALGIHPHDAKEANDTALTKIEMMLGYKKAIAVGEIGLDYHYDFSPHEVQKIVFRDFLRLAKKIKKPVIIHNRESDKDMLDILESEASPDLTGQFHCFSGDVAMAKRLLAMGFHISFTGSVTFPKNQYAETIEMIPLDRLLLETDSPYMSPVPFRGKRCDPTMIPKTVEKISEIKKISMEQIYTETYKNSINLFRFPNKNEEL
jgi:TatD DNase family protein